MKAVFVAALIMTVGAARADDIITMIQLQPVQGPKKAYLNPNWIDEGYVGVRAIIQNPDGLTCINPTSSNTLNNLFFSKKLDVVITAQPVGFPNVDSSREIPVAVYSWEDGRYCRSVWAPPVEIVPYTPLRQITDPNAKPKDQPSIILRVRSTGASNERISGYAHALIGISAVYATGGAAATLTQLSSIVSGPAVKYLTEKLTTKSTTDQTDTVSLTWSEIVGGLQTKPVRLIKTEITRRYTAPSETPQQAIARVKINPSSGIELLQLDFSFDIRRSLLVEDPDISQENSFPNPEKPELAKSELLNFPRRRGDTTSLTINQILNANAPSAFAQVVENKSRGTGCARLASELGTSFAKRIDLPILFDAAIGSVLLAWNQDPQFWTVCINEDQKKLIETYKQNKDYFGKSTDKLLNYELDKNLPFEWKGSYTEYAEELKTNLLSSGARKASRLRQVLPDTISPDSIDWPASLSSPTDDPSTIATYFSGINISKAGCIFPYSDAAGQLHIALVFVASDKTGKPGAYLMALRLRTGDTAGPVGSNIIYVQVKDLASAANLNYLNTVNLRKFAGQSICGSAGKASSELLAALVKEN